MSFWEYFFDFIDDSIRQSPVYLGFRLVFETMSATVSFLPARIAIFSALVTAVYSMFLERSPGGQSSRGMITDLYSEPWLL